MAGGAGNNLWPVCRESRPKPFMDVALAGRTFLEMTYDRFRKILPAENILVVTHTRLAGLVREQLPSLPEKNLLEEPYSRGTAPCITLANSHILHRDKDAVITVTPADHIIADETLFARTMDAAITYAAEHDVLMTLGILPTHPSASYGYIQAKRTEGSDGTDAPMKVKTFTEKPDEALAKVFLGSGEFFWNSGIYVWKASVIRKEINRYMPALADLFRGWEEVIETPRETEFMQHAYAECPKISIDYGVMEKTDIAWLYPGRFGWSDIDSWEGMFRQIADKDASGNAANTGRILARDLHGCLVIAKDKRKLYALKGLEDYLVIDTDDALLVCPRDEKSFKDLVSGLGMPEYEADR